MYDFVGEEEGQDLDLYQNIEETASVSGGGAAPAKKEVLTAEMRAVLRNGIKVVRMDRETAERMLLGFVDSGPGCYVFRESKSEVG